MANLKWPGESGAARIKRFKGILFSLNTQQRRSSSPPLSYFNLLILGGTGHRPFHVDYALNISAHKVTVFNRGIRHPGELPAGSHNSSAIATVPSRPLKGATGIGIDNPPSVPVWVR